MSKCRPLKNHLYTFILSVYRVFHKSYSPPNISVNHAFDQNSDFRIYYDA